MDNGFLFSDDFFDTTVINVTLHMTYRPDFVMSEALRVSKNVIISFPNFATVITRIEVMLGRFPRFPLFGYQWYNTRHIHLFSIKDFREYCKNNSYQINDEIFFGLNSRSETFFSKLFPNLLSGTAIFLITKK